MFDDFSKPKRKRVMAYRIKDNLIRLSINEDEVEYQCMVLIAEEFCRFDADTCPSYHDRMVTGGAIMVVRGGYNPDEVVEYLMSFNHRDETAGFRKEALNSPLRGKMEIWVRDDRKLPLI